MTVPLKTNFSVKQCFPFFIFMLLFGCQKPEPQPIPEQVQKQSQQDETVDLSLLCKNLEKNMLAINAERTTFALEQINQDLKLCLPLSTFAEQQHLLALSTKMYNNFLTVDRTAAQQSAFEAYAFDLSQHPTIQQNHFEQLTLRDQYLLKHKGQAYIELFDSGKGRVNYRRSPEYLARIFAPYIPPAEQVFIENLATQNMQPVLSEHILIVEPHEIASRALFWEDYLDQYPKSSYRKDAEYLLQMYTLFLFKGTQDSPVSDSYIDKYAIQSSSLDEIEKLAEVKNSHLATQATKFLHFLQLSEQQRLKEIPVQLSPEEQQSQTENQLAVKQLDQYLGLANLSLSNPRDCFSDAVCL
ncbi:hypothetical protein [Acinetobacter sp. ANC 4169]|jgi:hypothetical protein|uniref:hypothetical protein n=1 Tax=Acinetobacter sp. ANC 4169 TaxID=1977879 RepID=UPI00196B1BA7|nr:hypothetical protein [Acinetobacter sp. ANC 4169]